MTGTYKFNQEGNKQESTITEVFLIEFQKSLNGTTYLFLFVYILVIVFFSRANYVLSRILSQTAFGETDLDIFPGESVLYAFSTRGIIVFFLLVFVKILKPIISERIINKKNTGAFQGNLIRNIISLHIYLSHFILIAILLLVFCNFIFSFDDLGIIILKSIVIIYLSYIYVGSITISFAYVSNKANIILLIGIIIWITSSVLYFFNSTLFNSSYFVFIPFLNLNYINDPIYVLTGLFAFSYILHLFGNYSFLYMKCSDNGGSKEYRIKIAILYLSITLLLLVSLGLNFKQIQAETEVNINSTTTKISAELVKEFFGENPAGYTAITINVWESWCIPCINEIDDLNKLVKQFDINKIKFVALSNSSEDDCTTVLHKANKEFNYTKKYQQDELIKKLLDQLVKPGHTYVVPQNIVIDSDGYVLLHLQGYKSKNYFLLRNCLAEIRN